MNIFQSINIGATFLVIGALLAGVGLHLRTIEGSPVSFLLANYHIVLVFLFILLFKLKTAFDDHKHFGEPHQFDSTLRYIGIILALLSWVVLGWAGYSVATPVRSSELIGISLIVSTAWVAVHIFEILIDKERRNKEIVISLIREKWVIINLIYLLCIITYLGWLSPVFPPEGSLALWALLGVLLYDLVTSRSYPVTE